MKRDFLYPLRRIHGFIHFVFGYVKFAFRLFFLKKAYVFCAPEHSNIGDSAILIAEKAFLNKNGYSPESIIEVSTHQCISIAKYPFLVSHKKNVFFFHGGGNMGDEWIAEEIVRRKLLSKFTHNRIIIFPQTCYYSDTAQGISEREKSVPIYSFQKNLTIFAREKESYKIMSDIYKGTSVILSPDIVLSMSSKMFGVEKQNREGILFCIRNDAERSLSPQVVDAIKETLKKEAFEVLDTDMYSVSPITVVGKEQAVKDKMEEISSAKVMVTDRLHGMVFAALTETPCVVFSNYNHKVTSTYDWIENLSYIKFAQDAESALNHIRVLLEMNSEDIKFDNVTLKPYFKEMAEVIKCDWT